MRARLARCGSDMMSVSVLYVVGGCFCGCRFEWDVCVEEYAGVAAWTTRGLSKKSEAERRQLFFFGKWAASEHSQLWQLFLSLFFYYYYFTIYVASVHYDLLHICCGSECANANVCGLNRPLRTRCGDSTTCVSCPSIVCFFIMLFVCFFAFII